MRSSKLKQFGLVMTGMVAGSSISLNFCRQCQPRRAPPLPVDELRAYADVFNAMRAGLCEPVEDKKLITDSISGMLLGWTRTPPISTPRPSRTYRSAPRASSAAWAVEDHMEDGFVKVISPIEDAPAFRAGACWRAT